MEQQIDQVRLADGTRVGFAVAGSGPPLMWLPGWVSHLELGWAFTQERRFYEAVATDRTLIRYDRPGCGLSDPCPSADPTALEMEVISAVAAAVGADSFDLIATSLSVPLALIWAGARPETVRRLVLYGGWLRGDNLGPPGVREHILGLVEQHWGLGSDVLTDIFAPDADAEFRAAFALYQRRSCEAATARRLLALGYDLDVTADAAKVVAPTTVIHREDDRAVPVAEGRRVAAATGSGAFVQLAGRTHIPFAGDSNALIDALRSGMGLPRSPARFRPTLTGRQLEVAALVAKGMSNRQIAERLVITERSAETHVERIRYRLGFRNRAQIAAWYVTSHAE